MFAHRGAYGRREAVPDLVSAWTCRQVAGANCYRINRDHPAVIRALNDPTRIG